MKRLAFLALACLALPLAADPLGDVRAALVKLTAREPIRATYQIQRSITNEGKFDNDKFTGTAAVELEGGGGDVRVVLSRPLLEQVEKEMQARAQNANLVTPTVSALVQIEPVETSNAIDFAPVLLRMLQGAKLVSDASSTFQGRPARALVIRLADRVDDENKGRLKIAENRLTLWLGTDLVPVGAEHVTQSKFSFLFFKGESKQKTSWYFARVTDRLIRVRQESSESGSGMGQKSNATMVATLKVH